MPSNLQHGCDCARIECRFNSFRLARLTASTTGQRARFSQPRRHPLGRLSRTLLLLGASYPCCYVLAAASGWVHEPPFN
jgi:hypothetical protein